MATIFLACAILGGGVLVVQLLLGLIGLDHHFDHDVTHLSDGLHLLSVRAVSAGIAFFGLAGWAMMVAGWPALLAAPVAVIPGFAAMIGVAYVMRTMLSMESDGSIRIANAIGVPGHVYLSIPGEKSGAGRVSVTVQGRTVEYDAVTSGPAIPTGAAVVVVDAPTSDSLEVMLSPDSLNEVRS